MNDMSIAPINTLAGHAPGIGHNHPPLAEQLAEEMAADKARADELLAAALDARIAGDADAANVATLVALLRDHEKAIDRARENRKRPFLEACRIIDATYGTVIRPLYLARAGEDGKGGLAGLLTAWQHKREAEAARERERIEAERRHREEEAERARQAAEAAKAQGAGSVTAELAAIRAREEADRLARQAETLRPEPIRSSVASVGSRRETAFEIIDLRKALGWLAKHRTAAITQAAKTIIGQHLKSLGVDAAGSAEIPGVAITTTTRAQVR